MNTLIDQFLTIATIIGQILLIGLTIWFVVNKNKYNKLSKIISANSIMAAFIVSLLATAGSLFYSEIMGYTPCTLCWYQRILMYPQVILFAIALWKQDKKIADYHIILSVIGTILAGYHYLLQIGFLPKIECSTVGFSLSCAERFMMDFGYITIPMMALTAFLLITVFMFIQKRFDK